MSDRHKLLTEARMRLVDAKGHVFRMQDLADELVRHEESIPHALGSDDRIVDALELRSRLKEARDWLEAADRQLMKLGAYRSNA